MIRYFVFILFAFFATPLAACEITERTGAPQVQVPGISICRTGYELLYRPEYKTAFWAAEHMTAMAVRGKADRKDDFQSDPLIPDHLEAQLSDYYKSGYARGHLAPVGNFRDDPREAQESFYLTNMVPQWQNCNNAGVWSQIERIVRDWTLHYGELYVVTGPIYSGEIKTIGNGVRVPDQLYKVVWNPKTNTTVGFVVPNVPVCKTKPRDFVVRIEQVEFLTGIKFFPKVKPESTENLWQ